MKFKIFSLIVLGAVAALNARADVAISKPALSVDFNKMINDGISQKTALKNDVDARTAEPATEEEAESAKVHDFVDVEVGWGHASDNVVDRRFDSVGEPKIVNFDEGT